MTTKTKITEVKLPTKLSDVIDIAVKDLRAVERSKQYDINMGAWHDGYVRPGIGTPAEKCSVCFAGSVMAKTLKVALDTDINDPWAAFSDHNASRLSALDTLRSGDIAEALDTLGRAVPFGVQEQVDMPSYSYDPQGFKDNMKKVAKLLRSVGE